ncbi:hypothetical protein J8I29_27105 [Labrys sp. LIt4]|uniref:Uncharacterized protein n=1 Tax=Labrys okinawensis TaxID=346911 RepID=A0A2S9Q629_9HYPH|nr:MULTISPECIES: hypothetical protein [Labrys]MBP0583024.1 hypothetical protein [Labrys sp. LIt4]PRH84822.1 hypothetical protein C5L14_25140 [Labrys okinawensis]
MRLKRRALDQLLQGRHAHKGGRTLAQRARNLTTIATAYSWDELLAERGIGHVTALEVERWLALNGLHLRQAGPGPFRQG